MKRASARCRLVGRTSRGRTSSESWLPAGASSESQEQTPDHDRVPLDEGTGRAVGLQHEVVDQNRRVEGLPRSGHPGELDPEKGRAGALNEADANRLVALDPGLDIRQGILESADDEGPPAPTSKEFQVGGSGRAVEAQNLAGQLNLHQGGRKRRRPVRPGRRKGELVRRLAGLLSPSLTAVACLGHDRLCMTDGVKECSLPREAPSGG